jgi:hypothetical protein
MNIPEAVFEVLDGCAAGFVPVNVAVDIAIEAHRQAPSANTLYVVILACQPTVTDTQQQLDYLAGLPDRAWEAGGKHQEATLAAIRRSIAWRSI